MVLFKACIWFLNVLFDAILVPQQRFVLRLISFPHISRKKYTGKERCEKIYKKKNFVIKGWLDLSSEECLCNAPPVAL